MKYLKQIILLTLFIFITGFKSKVSKINYKSYYYVSAPILKHDKSINRFVQTGELYISTLQSKNHSVACTFTEASVANQFRDYVDANYNVELGTIKGRIFSVNVFSKSKAIEYYRKTKKRYKKIKTLQNFKFYCNDE